MIHDHQQSYGIISRLFHWLMVFGFIIILGTIIAWKIDEDYFSLIDLHKSVGFLLLIAVVFRFLWMLKNRKQRPHNSFIAHLGHWALYALMFTVPFIGMLRQYGAARGDFSVFGVHIMSKAPERIEWMAQLGNLAHSKLGILLFILVIGHILMAIYHQIKGEKILNRMIGR